MLVEQKIIDGKQRLEFKYKIQVEKYTFSHEGVFLVFIWFALQSGPTPIKSYGLALARCLRFPSSLIDRAEELVDKIEDSSINGFMTNKVNSLIVLDIHF